MNYTTVGPVYYTYFFLDANVTGCSTAQSMAVDVQNRPAASTTPESTVSGTNYCVTATSCTVHTGWGHPDYLFKVAPVCFHASSRVVANGAAYHRYFPAGTYGNSCY
ncbi:hypothetical protein [Nocardioides dilutus]